MKKLAILVVASALALGACSKKKDPANAGTTGGEVTDPATGTDGEMPADPDAPADPANPCGGEANPCAPE